MMDIKEAVELVENSKVFNDWRMNNKESFLSHCFTMLEGGNLTWYIGYYNPDGTMDSFIIDKDRKNDIKREHSDEVFTKDGVKPINLANVEIDFNKAVEITKEIQVSNYKMDMPQKIICILQNLDSIDVWNITYIANTLSVINFKINAKTGIVVDNKKESLMSFKA